MIGLELVCLAIVSSYVAFRMWRARSRRERAEIASQLAALAVAGFVGEDTLIRAHGYYAYATGWSVRLDRVPVVIVLVWPIVIHSAWSIARIVERGRGATRIATVAALVVLADASLIEPIAVRAGLWRWTEPGLFGVPLVGVAGWAFFAWAAVNVLERGRVWAVCVLAPLATHAMILGAWWGAFRWTQGEIAAPPATVLAWGVSLALSLRVARARGPGFPRSELFARLPGAAFFFVLLALTGAPRDFAAPDERPYVAPPDLLFTLVAYALAFAPPYLVALAVGSTQGLETTRPSGR
ncbi:MAG: carotenoid biosynthesis protein [Labilithrix sp.]|nr:carotenoid biosynthesis protein [Labilithrix sp.]